MSIVRIVTEGDSARIARAEIIRTLEIALKDAQKGEPLDEVTGTARRGCDDVDSITREIRRRGMRWEAVVEELYARAMDPWVSIRIVSTELASVRVGTLVTLIGPEGSGKSSFALQLLAQHEREVGPVVYVTPELDADEAGGRSIGQDHNASWKEVLMGQVPRAQIGARPRFVILQREDATLAHLTEECEALHEEFPGQPILVVWDHLQASPGETDGERLRIAKLSSDLRRMAKRLRIVIVSVSQTSRDGSKKLTSGELVGAEAGKTGAESAQIERDSYVTIIIGDHHKREDGAEDRSVSVGKNRMGASDIVFKAIYTGRTGGWSVIDHATPAADVRAEREGRDDSKRIGAVELAMLKAAEQATAPLTREQLRELAATKRDYARRAIANLLARGDLVEVAKKLPRNRYSMLWTPSRAAEHGVAVVTSSGNRE